MGYYRDIMDYRRNIIVIITCVNILIFLIVCLAKFNRNLDSYAEKIESVHSGIIVDKGIRNARSGLFSSTDGSYYIEISTDVDEPSIFFVSNSKSIKKATKKFTVSEAAYLNYNVGDFFDSYNYNNSISSNSSSVNETSYQTTVINGTEYELVPKES